MILFTKQFISSSCHYYKFIPLSVIFLIACGFNQELTTKKDSSIINSLWITHQQQLAKVTKFQIHGTFAYITPDNKIYAKFFWQQNNLTNYRLLLINPLGGIELELNVTPTITQIIDRNGKKYINDHPTQMIYQLTGMKIPIENLPHWLIGLPINATSFTLNKSGLLKIAEYSQNNEIWQLNYLAYHQNKQPSRIELTKGKLRIKLKIDNWTFK